MFVFSSLLNVKICCFAQFYVVVHIIFLDFGLLRGQNNLKKSLWVLGVVMGILSFFCIFKYQINNQLYSYSDI